MAEEGEGVMATDLAARLYDSIVSVERDQLRAQVAALTAERDALRSRVEELSGAGAGARIVVRDMSAELRTLRARVAELESPPVVPEGWQLRKIGRPEWRKWEALHNGKMTSWCGHGDDLPIARALAWAIEHDQRPPHAGDE